ncbi:MAG: hypothetical protein EOO77_05575 [Oxalobacteraceae bacterium]|nr:MAG: hypothetical protein EOO77_05575 [Oxalobacteraceae bacterium]
MIRIAITLVILVTGYIGVMQSLSEITKKADPLRAHLLMAGDGRITAYAAEKSFQDRPSGDSNAPSAKLARLAVRQDATAVLAFVVLASQAEMRGDIKAARRLFDYAEALSRRNLPTQLWAIEDAVSRGKIPEALRHYDIALRTSRDASKILYPVLASALSEPAIRSSLTATLAKKPNWGSSFIAYSLGSNADPRHIANLFYGMRAAGVTVTPEASSSLVNRLLLIGAPNDAWRYYASLRKGIVPDRSRDPSFSTNVISSSQFDWVPTDRNGVSVSIQRGDHNGVVDYSVPTGNGGILLQQLQMLPPGRYRLTGSGSGVDQPETTMPYWALTCQGGQEIGRVALVRSKQDISTFSGQFDIPTNCPVQLLTFVARLSDNFGGTEGRINHVELTPIQ